MLIIPEISLMMLEMVLVFMFGLMETVMQVPFDS
jgi:hypothetical protein